jgi:hypothetical protein
MNQGLTKIFFAAIFLITISSCDKKSCTKVACPVGKSCYQGICLCNDGYEGVNCDTPSFIKYTGSWNVSENCSPNSSYYSNGVYSVYIQQVIGLYGNGNNVISITSMFGIGSLYCQILNTDPNNLGCTLFVPAQSIGGVVSVANSYGTYYPYTNGSVQIVLTLNYTPPNQINYTCQETLYKI